MSELIKAYTDELDLIYDQIEILWAEADKIDYLYNRKAALRAMINKYKGE